MCRHTNDSYQLPRIHQFFLDWRKDSIASMTPTYELTSIPAFHRQAGQLELAALKQGFQIKWLKHQQTSPPAFPLRQTARAEQTSTPAFSPQQAAWAEQTSTPAFSPQQAARAEQTSTPAFPSRQTALELTALTADVDSYNKLVRQLFLPDSPDQDRLTCYS